MTEEISGTGTIATLKSTEIVTASMESTEEAAIELLQSATVGTPNTLVATITEIYNMENPETVQVIATASDTPDLEVLPLKLSKQLLLYLKQRILLR